MEALGAAASIFAVVSLAVELAGAARELIGFLGTITDAPSEVNRLRDLLNLVYAAASGIRNVLEQRHRLRQDVPILAADDISTALVDCQRKLRLIRKVLDKVEGMESGRNLAVRSWARFRLAVQKEDVMEFERQLGLSLQVLNILLTTSFMSSHTHDMSRILDKFETLAAGTDLIPRGAEADPTSSWQQPEPRESPLLLSDHKFENDATYEELAMIVTRKRRSQQWHMPLLSLSACKAHHRDSILGSITSTSVTHAHHTTQEDGEHRLEAKMAFARYRIAPSFLSWSLEVAITHMQSLTPTISLRFQNHISRKEPVYRESCQVIQAGDIPSFQRLLQSGKIGVNTIFYSSDPDDDQRSVELLVAFSPSRTLSNFFLRQSNLISVDFIKSFLKIAAVGSWNRTNPAPHDLTEQEVLSLFRLAVSKLDRQEYDAADPAQFLSSPSESASVRSNACIALTIMEHLATEGLENTIWEVDCYVSGLLFLLCSWWAVCSKHVRLRRNKLTSSLIKAGANLRYKDWDDISMIEAVMLYSPLEEGPQHLDDWLLVLQQTGVDINQYLRETAQRKYRSRDILLARDSEWHCIRPRIITFETGSDQLSPPPRPVFRRWLNPGGPAFLVLAEFDFCKDMVLEQGERLPDLWPFHTSWHTLCMTGLGTGTRDMRNRRREHRYCTFKHTRFDRKQRKKMARLNKAMGLEQEQCVIPGAWPCD